MQTRASKAAAAHVAGTSSRPEPARQSTTPRAATAIVKRPATSIGTRSATAHQTVKSSARPTSATGIRLAAKSVTHAVRVVVNREDHDDRLQFDLDEFPLPEDFLFVVTAHFTMEPNHLLVERRYPWANNLLLTPSCRASSRLL
ncbi:hypothetical protein BC835DRAFT_90299 [Cytidiella melzeri]|nr:hypothetical protein BC835DRAFT_90299 [Cytidiella melzeri]